jgi:DUF4097 and DUF4098 domain-containing protein YvlB
MSSFPPPPPPPPQYPPNPTAYNRAVWKAQRQAAKQQAQWARRQAKLQRRLTRPRSLVGPLIILALGILFLLGQLGKISFYNVADWYARWWPLVLVAAGVVLLGEWALDTHAHASSQPYRRRSLGGGVIFLLFVLAFFGVTSREAYRHFHWGENNQWGFVFPNFDEVFGEEHDFDDSLSAPIAPDASLLIRNPHGDVTVTGVSEDGQVHVSVHKTIHARSDSAAFTMETELQPQFTDNGKFVTLDVPNQSGSQADLTVQLPRTVSLTINADHGDVDVEQLHADATVSANNGTITFTGIDGNVTGHINDRHSDFTAHSITGDVRIDGHGGDANISDITGAVFVEGDFFGTTHLEHVSKELQFKSIRTLFTATRLDGSFDIDNKSIEANQLLGPVDLTTRYGKDITLNRVQGDVRIANSVKGSISVTGAPPVGKIDISNSHGSVDVGVPEDTGFTLNAQTHNGDVENDFGIKNSGSESSPQLQGKVGNGAANITVLTADGDVTIRKASVSPLTPAAPTPPKLTVTAPQAPAAPQKPKN